jgi:hypothetical protein
MSMVGAAAAMTGALRAEPVRRVQRLADDGASTPSDRSLASAGPAPRQSRSWAAPLAAEVGWLLAGVRRDGLAEQAPEQWQMPTLPCRLVLAGSVVPISGRPILSRATALAVRRRSSRGRAVSRRLSHGRDVLAGGGLASGALRRRILRRRILRRGVLVGEVLVG